MRVVKTKVLYVDDESLLTRLVKMFLETTGDFEVAIINNPLEAISAAGEFKPDFILLDQLMPGLDGCSLANRLQKDLHYSGAPIAFFTASPVDGFPVLAKPATGEQIAGFIRQTIKENKLPATI